MRMTTIKTKTILEAIIKRTFLVLESAMMCNLKSKTTYFLNFIQLKRRHKI
jgi:hypothetical protein